MTSSTVSNTRASYKYDGDGLRAEKVVVGGQTTSYTWDVNAALPVVLDDGAPNYLYGLGLISDHDVAGGSSAREYYLQDGLGSTAALVNDAQSVVGTYRYDAFGKLRSSTGSNPTEYHFTGQQDDSANGFIYLRARYYDPAVGRFVSKDPIAGDLTNPQSINRYVYGFSNPVKYLDPDGRDPLDPQWRNAFDAAHNGRSPDALDESIRLFSLAYQNEWFGQELWNRFCNADGSVNRAAVESWFQSPPTSRSWDSMARALVSLSAFYKTSEEGMFVRDVGFLYAGMPGRSRVQAGHRIGAREATPEM